MLITAEAIVAMLLAVAVAVLMYLSVVSRRILQCLVAIDRNLRDGVSAFGVLGQFMVRSEKRAATAREEILVAIREGGIGEQDILQESIGKTRSERFNELIESGYPEAQAEQLLQSEEELFAKLKKAVAK